MATRDIFFEELYAKATAGEDIVVVTSDLGAIALDRFIADFPGRFVNVGIAEQNLISIAAGLANAGRKVFAYGNAPFIWSRAYDQVRQVMGGAGLPITLLSVGVGLNTAFLGPSHFVTDDLTALRCLPHIQINAVNNASMARRVVEYSLCLKKPNYIRMEHTVTDNLYEGKEIDYNRGFVLHGEGREVLLVSTASTVYECIKVAMDLERQGISTGVVEIITVPVCEAEFFSVLSVANKIVTVEEHVLQGGLGSYVCELMVDWGMSKPTKRIGLDFKSGYYSHYGTEMEVRHALGIDNMGIKDVVLQWLGTVTQS